jgi:hypothetical protein
MLSSHHHATHGFADADEHLAYQAGGEQAMLDDSRRRGQPRSQGTRLVHFS